MTSGVTRIQLPDGTSVLARVSDVEDLAEPGAGSTYADAGLGERLATRMESLRGLITGVAASVAEGARAVSPDEVSVSFGVEIAARSGKVVGLLADGEAKGAITVTLTWRGAPPEDVGQAG
ncbi:CU044_2847 family protein [Streptomyces sp. 4N509B]|uniref:CU044_2847 family protein n=1 Tax=Streptomyces sp. 4N509B TaxID=3457413 RepID=UPI003FD47A5B